jgi:putative membrane protein
MFTSLAAVAHSAVAHSFVGPMMGSGLGFLFLLIPIFWIVVIIVIVAFVGRRWRRAGWNGPASHGAPWANPARSAEGTLAERFAQGDIDETEYRARLEVLRANSGPDRPAK